MWETLLRAPLGNITLRKFIVLLSTAFVACFTYILSTPANAFAEDAYFKDAETITYKDVEYVAWPTTKSPDDMFGSEIPNKSVIFLYRKSGTMHVIFLEGFTKDNYTNATEGSYITYTDTDIDSREDKLQNPSEVIRISIAPRAPPADTDSGTSSCVIEGGLGWIICPITRTLAAGMDFIYERVSLYLKVTPLSTATDTALYRAWGQIRNIANVLFVIGFLALVYSQITGAFMSNYTIKKMLPRIVIAAIMVNISYWICALAVDLSNAIGVSIEDLFNAVRESLVGKEGNTWNLISWESIGTLILSGGALAAGVGIAGYIGATTLAASAVGGGVIFLFLPLLISAFFIILITFLILAARQAIIVILITVAPLAFVAYLLPNTEEWFTRWRKALTVLLVLFPAFSVVFAGAQLAASIIIQNAKGPNALNMVILAMGVQVAPLAITPLLLKLGGGILNRFAGIVNNPAKGVFDRGKSWANERRDQSLAQGNAIMASRVNRGIMNPNRRFNPSSMAYRRNQNRLMREGEKSAHESASAAYFTQTANGRRIAMMNQRAKFEQSLGDNQNQAQWNNTVLTNPNLRSRAHQSHEAHKRADLYQRAVDAEGDEHWAHTQQHDHSLRAIRRNAHLSEGRAKLTEESITNADERALQTQISNTAKLRKMKVQSDVDAAHSRLQSENVEAAGKLKFQQEIDESTNLQALQTQTRLNEGRADIIEGQYKAKDDRTLQEAINRNDHGMRDKKIQSDVNTGIAGLYKGRVEALGQQQLRNNIEASRALSRVVQDTHHAKKQAEIYENIVQKAAEESWINRVRHDEATQTLYLRGVHQEEDANIAEEQLKGFTKEVKARGNSARGLAESNTQLANTIQSTSTKQAAYSEAIQNLEDEHKGYVLKQLSEDKALRNIAGAGTQLGATKALAKAQSGITRLYLENVKAQTSVYSNDGYRVDEMLAAMQNNDYKLHDGTTVDTVAQHAAIQYTLEDIGNNWSVQKVIDWADTQGMELVEGQNGEPDKYYDAASYREAKKNGTLDQLQALSSDEISSRRDLMQMVVSGYRNGKNKVSYFTATMQERMSRGLSSARYSEELDRDMTLSESAILGEAKMGKYEGERVTTMDPDELSRMIQVLRTPKYRDQLTSKQKQSILSKITEAQTSNQTRHRIKDRERGLMNVLASYLEIPEGVQPTEEELRKIENSYYEVTKQDDDGSSYNVRVPANTPDAVKVEIDVKAPNVYDTSRQDDIAPSGSGLNPPRG
jgi:hypothetical protein